MSAEPAHPTLPEIQARLSESHAGWSREEALRHYDTDVAALLTLLDSGDEHVIGQIAEAANLRARIRELEAENKWLKAERLLGANTGHGHVRPRPDGVKARCGGPALCKVCQQEQALQVGSSPEWSGQTDPPPPGEDD